MDAERKVPTRVYLYILCLAVCLRPTNLRKKSLIKLWNTTWHYSFLLLECSSLLHHLVAFQNMSSLVWVNYPLLFCGDQSLENEVRILHKMEIDDTEWKWISCLRTNFWMATRVSTTFSYLALQGNRHTVMATHFLKYDNLKLPTRKELAKAKLYFHHEHQERLIKDTRFATKLVFLKSTMRSVLQSTDRNRFVAFMNHMHKACTTFTRIECQAHWNSKDRDSLPLIVVMFLPWSTSESVHINWLCFSWISINHH